MSSHLAVGRHASEDVPERDRGPEWYANLRASLSERAATLKIPDFLCGVLMAFVGEPIPGLGTAFPVSYAAIVFMLILAFTRRPAHRVPTRLHLWTLILGLGLLFAVFVSAFQDYSSTGDWVRRLARILVTVLLAYTMSTGRVDYASVVRGFIFMLVVNVPLWLGGLVRDNYAGFLTGITNDKNQAGLNYAIAGIMVLLVYKNPKIRWGLFALFAVFLWMTGSRTSLGGYAAALVWILVARKLSTGFKLILIGVLAWGVYIMESQFARIGAFSNREGTDWFREQIDKATVAKLNGSPWWGEGLGQGFVNMQNRQFFFHNNYYGLRIEGGWVLAVIVVAFTVHVGMRMFSDKRLDERRIIAQGATIALMVCAWKLGDVFFTVVWALVMTAGIRAFIYEDGTAMINVRSRERLKRERLKTLYGEDFDTEAKPFRDAERRF